MTRVLFALALLLASEAKAAQARPNVILFFIDTLRADHVSCLGYPRKTTPSLDSLAARGTLFETAISPSSWSLPSYCSILSSLHAPAHAVDEVRQHFDKSFTTLPKILGVHGYDTAGFVGGGHLSRIFGLDNGFALYVDQPHYGSFFHTVPKALEWIDRKRDGPFFAFVQGYDAHAPYQAPLGFDEMYDPGYRGTVHDLDVLGTEVLLNITGNVVHLSREKARRPREAAFASSPLDIEAEEKLEDVPLTEADRRHIVAHYDGTVTYADSWLGVLIEELRARSLLENTLLVVAGDHGESLGEHGYYGHRQDLYEEQIRVPLLFTGPGIAASRRVTQAIEMVDLAPTILDLCSISPCEEFQGRSLGAHVRSGSAVPRPDEDRPAFSALRNRLSARTARWHLVYHSTGQTQLFDVKADPAEQTDLAAKHPEVTQRLRGLALDWHDRFRRPPRGADVKLTPDEKAMFKEKGYW